MRGTIDADLMRERIRELRKANGMTLQAVGEAMGVTKQAVSQMENNPTGMSLKTLMALANAIGCNVYDFFMLSQSTMSKHYESNDEFRGIGGFADY